MRRPWAVSGKEGGRLALELSSSLLSMAAVTDTSAAAMTGRLREAACTGAACPGVHAASAMCPITSIFGRHTLLHVCWARRRVGAGSPSPKAASEGEIEEILTHGMLLQNRASTALHAT